MNTPTVLRSECYITGCSFVCNYQFKSGQTVPIYNLTDMNAFNQLV